MGTYFGMRMAYENAVKEYLLFFLSKGKLGMKVLKEISSLVKSHFSNRLTVSIVGVKFVIV